MINNTANLYPFLQETIPTLPVLFLDRLYLRALVSIAGTLILMGLGFPVIMSFALAGGITGRELSFSDFQGPDRHWRMQQLTRFSEHIRSNKIQSNVEKRPSLER